MVAAGVCTQPLIDNQAALLALFVLNVLNVLRPHCAGLTVLGLLHANTFQAVA